MLAAALFVMTSAAEVHNAGSPDRNALLSGLEQRAATGVPRHLDHDEGEELQAAVTAALTSNPNDGEIAWAAVRASFAIVPSVAPVIYDSPPSIGIELLAPLSLPWKIATTGTIDVSLDGSSWRHGADLSPGFSRVAIPLEKTFPRAARPGFHVVRLRAALRFSGQPGFVPASETRELPPQTYGVTGTSPAGLEVAAFVNSAARADASDLDPALPRVPFDTWLRTVAATADSPPTFWNGLWCEERTGIERPPTSICARTMIGVAPEGGHAELWVKVATVDTSGERPTWTAVTPTLDGLDLMSSRRSTVPLTQLPFALRSVPDEWPRAMLSFDAGSITLSPEKPRPGEAVTIRASVRNTGTVDLYGLTIGVLAFDSPEGPALQRRRFVRSIPAGESVSIETAAMFPRGYGGVMVDVFPLSDHMVFPPLMADGSNGFSSGVRLVRPDLAPPGFVDRVREAIGCKPGCTNIR